MTPLLHQLINATINTHLARGARAIEVQSSVIAARHPSHSDVLAHDVAYVTGEGIADAIRLITKDAPLVERQHQAWFAARELPVPWGYALDLTSNDRAPLCLQYISDTPVPGSIKEVARSLAAIHAAAIGRGCDLARLPRADSACFADFIVDRCWRKPWQSTLENGDFVDAYGHRTPPGPPGDFRGAFGYYTRPLEDTATRFLQVMDDLWQEGDSLTLIHADFHDEHVRFDAGRPYLIDWGRLPRPKGMLRICRSPAQRWSRWVSRCVKAREKACPLPTPPSTWS